MCISGGETVRAALLTVPHVIDGVERAHAGLVARLESVQWSLLH